MYMHASLEDFENFGVLVVSSLRSLLTLFLPSFPPQCFGPRFIPLSHSFCRVVFLCSISLIVIHTAHILLYVFTACCSTTHYAVPCLCFFSVGWYPGFTICFGRLFFSFVLFLNLDFLPCSCLVWFQFASTFLLGSRTSILHCTTMMKSLIT